MKALALDTAISCITIAAKNDDNLASLVLDIGMRQSEKLLPAIDYVLSQADLKPGELDYTVLCEGPGSFTGLRLGFAALKAIELFGGRVAADKDCVLDQKAGENEKLSQNLNAGGRSKIPLYAINSLDAYAQPYLDLDFLTARKFFPATTGTCASWKKRFCKAKTPARTKRLCKTLTPAAAQFLFAAWKRKRLRTPAKKTDCSKEKKSSRQKAAPFALKAFLFWRKKKSRPGRRRWRTTTAPNTLGPVKQSSGNKTSGRLGIFSSGSPIARRPSA